MQSTTSEEQNTLKEKENAAFLMTHKETSTEMDLGAADNRLQTEVNISAGLRIQVESLNLQVLRLQEQLQHQATTQLQQDITIPQVDVIAHDVGAANIDVTDKSSIILHKDNDASVDVEPNTNSNQNDLKFARQTVCILVTLLVYVLSVLGCELPGAVTRVLWLTNATHHFTRGSGGWMLFVMRMCGALLFLGALVLAPQWIRALLANRPVSHSVGAYVAMSRFAAPVLGIIGGTFVYFAVDSDNVNVTPWRMYVGAAAFGLCDAAAALAVVSTLTQWLQNASRAIFTAISAVLIARFSVTVISLTLLPENDIPNGVVLSEHVLLVVWASVAAVVGTVLIELLLWPLQCTNVSSTPSPVDGIIQVTSQSDVRGKARRTANDVSQLAQRMHYNTLSALVTFAAVVGGGAAFVWSEPTMQASCVGGSAANSWLQGAMVMGIAIAGCITSVPFLQQPNHTAATLERRGTLMSVVSATAFLTASLITLGRGSNATTVSVNIASALMGLAMGCASADLYSMVAMITTTSDILTTALLASASSFMLTSVWGLVFGLQPACSAIGWVMLSISFVAVVGVIFRFLRRRHVDEIDRSTDRSLRLTEPVGEDDK